MKLSEIPTGGAATVLSLAAPAAERRRLVELGLRNGVTVEVVRRAPLGGPIAVRVGSGVLAMRPENAERIIVEEVGDA